MWDNFWVWRCKRAPPTNPPEPMSQDQHQPNPSLELLVNTELGVEIETEPPFSLPDGRRVQRRSKILRHDRLNQVTDHELIYYVSGADDHVERVAHSFSMRNTFKFEMEHLLIRLGFTIEQVYSDFDRTPFGSKYPGELIFVTS